MKGNYHFDSLRLLYNYLWKTPNNSPRGETHAFHVMFWREQALRCWRDSFEFLQQHLPVKVELVNRDSVFQRSEEKEQT